MNVSSVRPRLQLCQQANPYGEGAYRQPSKGTITDLVIDLIPRATLWCDTWFEACPECHHAPLEKSSATMVELAIAKLKDVLRK